MHRLLVLVAQALCEGTCCRWFGLVGLDAGLLSQYLNLGGYRGAGPTCKALGIHGLPVVVIMDIGGVVDGLGGRYLPRPHSLFKISVAKIFNSSFFGLDDFRPLSNWGHGALHQTADL